MDSRRDVVVLNACESAGARKALLRSVKALIVMIQLDKRRGRDRIRNEVLCRYRVRPVPQVRLQARPGGGRGGLHQRGRYSQTCHGERCKSRQNHFGMKFLQLALFARVVETNGSSHRPHESMTFRSFAAVNGALCAPPPAVEEPIDGGKTSETRGFHEVDGALRRADGGQGVGADGRPIAPPLIRPTSSATFSPLAGRRDAGRSATRRPSSGRRVGHLLPQAGEGARDRAADRL